MKQFSSQTDLLLNGLNSFLSNACGEPAAVEGLKRLTGGTSHETWAFDLMVPSNGSDPTALVLRRDFTTDVLDLDLGSEFSLLEALYQSGIPVPEPRFCVEQNSPIDTPFIISERLDGKDIRKEMAENSNDAKLLGRKLTEIQASIHSLDWPSLIDKTRLKVTDSPIDHQVNHWCKVATNNITTPEPMLSFAISWLGNNLPSNTSVSLVHGDFKANNLLFNSNHQVAVIDWELAHIGDPYEDLAFTLLWTTRFDIVGGMLTREEYLACYEQATGEPIDRDRLFYWQIFSLVKLAAIFFKGFAENSSGGVEKPARIMLVRAMPWVNTQLGTLLVAWYKDIDA